MKMKKESLVLGLALFAMFFGAGNLIFPPSIGASVGDRWYIAVLGFFITGIGLPLLGIMAFNKIGSLNKFAEKISPKFNKIYCSLLILSLGPLLAIPRTGATTFEMGIAPNFPTISPIIVSIIYFSITLIMVINPSKIIDNIGKILTPIILLMLTLIITKGIFFKIGIPIKTELIENAFSFGFLEGYQTMDALASVLMGAVIMSGLKTKGFTDRKVQKTLIIRAGIVASIGLAMVYGGLLYLGATSSSVVSGLEKTDLTMYIADATLGQIGNTILGICVSAACLTTSIGLVTIVGEYFSKITKFSYKTIVILTCIFSGAMSVIGVGAIIKISVPILVILYPITIVLIMLNLFEVKNSIIYKASITIAITTSIIEIGYNTLGIHTFGYIYNLIPFAKDGFIWFLPIILITPIATILENLRKKRKLTLLYANKDL